MSEGGNDTIVVTGANGHIGRQLLTRLASESRSALAVVRSKRAATSLETLPSEARPETRIIDYADASSLEEAMRACRAVVHLVGVIKESRAAPFADAHERPCQALQAAAAAAGLERIIYLSIIGADRNSKNECLASRARAEDILLGGSVPTTVIRVAMVMGPGDFATRALRGQATSSIATLIGGGATLQQPIDASDMVQAILAALALPEPGNAVLELAGPECLSHRQLVQRAAELYQSQPTIVPVPLFLMQCFAAVISRVSASPPITPAMLGVLQHDDRVDTGPACKRLGIELTPLDETLRRYIGPEAEEQ